MKDFETQLLVALVAGLVILMTGGIGTVLFTFVKGWVKDVQAVQARIASSCSRIDVTLATMNGQIEQARQWQDMHEQTDDERHGQITQGQRDIWKAVQAGKGVDDGT